MGSGLGGCINARNGRGSGENWVWVGKYEGAILCENYIHYAEVSLKVCKYEWVER